MTSILCGALGYVISASLIEVPPAALFSTAPIFSAVAPRASSICSLTPPLLALLRRSPFFCFTQNFVLSQVTDEDVCQIIRECVSIKHLDVSRSGAITGSFVKDAILADSGGLITRTLEELHVSDALKNGDSLVPLLVPTTSPMTPTFLRSMIAKIFLTTFPPRLMSQGGKMQLLHSALDALEGRQRQLWEPSLILATSLFIGALIDERGVRRCVAIIEELIDADEYVALLAVELLGSLLWRCSNVVVPLLLLQSDAMRGVLMLCDKYVERIKRGERVPCLMMHGPLRLPLRVIESAVRALLAAAPTCNVLEVMSYRDGERVRTVLDIIVACRTCPQTRCVDRVPRDSPDRYRATIVGDKNDGDGFCKGLERFVVSHLARVYPKPFNVDGSPEQRQLLDLIASQVQDVFALCDQIAGDPSEHSNLLRDAGAWISSVSAALQPAFCLVRKLFGDDPCELYQRANAHFSPEQRALDRVRFLNFLFSIHRRSSDGDDGEMLGETRTFADIFFTLLHAWLQFECELDAFDLINRSSETGQQVACFLCTALVECRTLIDEVAEKSQEPERSSRCRPRQDHEEPGEETQVLEQAASAAAMQGLDAIAALLRRPGVVHALLSIGVQDANAALIGFALERGCIAADEVEPLRADVAQRYAKRCADYEGYEYQG